MWHPREAFILAKRRLPREASVLAKRFSSSRSREVSAPLKLEVVSGIGLEKLVAWRDILLKLSLYKRKP